MQRSSCRLIGKQEATSTPSHCSLNWQNIRADISVKEDIFAPFLAQYGDPHRAGGGRDLLMNQTLQNYDGLLQRCSELAILQERIQKLLAEQHA
jgi:hypothetical protein